MANDSTRPSRMATAAIAAALLALAGCTAGGGSLCTAAGGSCAGGTCIRSSPEQQAAQERCQARGGVYLGGQDICAVGAGGP